MAQDPTPAQQLGMAYAPMPFAALSLLSSSGVIYHILVRRPQRRKRLYHRLVLAMNVALVPLSINYLLGSLAVPAGTEHYPAAAGNIATCTASGFIALTLTMTVPFYYGSLGIQAYLSIKNNFREENIVWMEKWVHLVAWIVPCAISTVVAATGNFNPVGSGCSLAASPVGCDVNPDVDCERGGNIRYYVYVVGFGQVFLYFVLPPVGTWAAYRLVRRLKRQAEMRSNQGMQLIREAARKEMMRAVTRQISTYLLSFWLTFVPTLIYFVYLTLTGEVLYNLLIIAICIFASQGLILTMVYFILPRMATAKVEVLPPDRSRWKRQTTVESIRSKAHRKENGPEREDGAGSRRRSSVFSIFDGTPDRNSPWAQFIDPDECDGDDVESTSSDVCNKDSPDIEKMGVTSTR